MIVTCERCATQFQLDDSRIPPDGVRVRCSRCKHAFQISLPDPVGGPETGGEEEESDWEFNADVPSGETTDAGVDVGPGSSSNVVDEMLGASAEFTTPPPMDRAESTGSSTEESLFAQPSGFEIGQPEDAAANDPIPGQGDAAPPDPSPAPTPAPEAPAAAASGPDALAPELESPSASSSQSLELEDSGPTPQLESEPEAPPRRRASDAAPAAESPDAADGPEGWDLLSDVSEHDDAGPDFGASGAGAAPTFEVDPRELIDDRPAWQTWLAGARDTIGWCVVVAMFAVGLHGGLQPVPVREPQPISLGDGLQVRDLSGRWIDHIEAGPIYVVSGRLHNRGDRSLPAPWLAVEAQGDSGQALAPPAPLARPRRMAELRELPLSTLARGDGLGGGGLRPGDERVFEAVVGALPSSTRRLRVVPSEAPPAAPLDAGMREADPGAGDVLGVQPVQPGAAAPAAAAPY